MPEGAPVALARSAWLIAPDGRRTPVPLRAVDEAGHPLPAPRAGDRVRDSWGGSHVVAHAADAQHELTLRFGGFGDADHDRWAQHQGSEDVSIGIHGEGGSATVRLDIRPFVRQESASDEPDGFEVIARGVGVNAGEVYVLTERGNLVPVDDRPGSRGSLAPPGFVHITPVESVVGDLGAVEHIDTPPPPNPFPLMSVNTQPFEPHSDTPTDFHALPAEVCVPDEARPVRSMKWWFVVGGAVAAGVAAIVVLVATHGSTPQAIAPGGANTSTSITSAGSGNLVAPRGTGTGTTDSTYPPQQRDIALQSHADPITSCDWKLSFTYPAGGSVAPGDVGKALTIHITGPGIEGDHAQAVTASGAVFTFNVRAGASWTAKATTLGDDAVRGLPSTANLPGSGC